MPKRPIGIALLPGSALYGQQAFEVTTIKAAPPPTAAMVRVSGRIAHQVGTEAGTAACTATSAGRNNCRRSPGKGSHCELTKPGHGAAAGTGGFSRFGVKETPLKLSSALLCDSGHKPAYPRSEDNT